MGQMWGIHIKACEQECLQDQVIRVGWPEFGDMTNLPADKVVFQKMYANVYPESKKGAIGVAAGVLYRFRFCIEVGDYVVFPSKQDNMVNIGIIEGGYEYDPSRTYPHSRSVQWLRSFSRTDFTQGALYEIGSALTLFSVKNYADEFLAALSGAPAQAGLDVSVGLVADKIRSGTEDFVLKRLGGQLKGYGLEDFVADLLGAMGYRTEVSKHGGDSGIDIVAYKDELPPRILVQVKSQDGNVQESAIQALKGAMREGDYGLFVSLSGYTKNARKYLEATPIIRGIDGRELVSLVLKYYEGLSRQYQRIIPLEKVYIPVPDDA